MKALVLSSGGLDSTTALALAVKEYGHENVISLSVSYGQKHTKELKAAEEESSEEGSSEESTEEKTNEASTEEETTEEPAPEETGESTEEESPEEEMTEESAEESEAESETASAQAEASNDNLLMIVLSGLLVILAVVSAIVLWRKRK